eukprot:gene14562-16717_t
MFDHSTGELLHDSAQGPKVNRIENGIYPVNYTSNGTFVEGGVRLVQNARSYNFHVGAGRVMKGWEFAIKTMRLGEISSFVMQPEHTFGSKGAPPLVQPNAILRFLFELVRIRPPWELNYPTMNEGDSVKESLAQQIMSGDSAFGEAIMRKRKPASHTSENENFARDRHGAQIVQGEIVNDGSSHKNTITTNPDLTKQRSEPQQSPQSIHSQPSSQTQQSTRTGTESNAERTFFDPAKHALDTTTEVDGEAQGYRWTETMTTMDIELPLRVKEGQYVHKSDLVVDIRASTVDVRFANGTTILAGPLQGKINPLEVTWALNDYAIQDQYKNHATQYLQVSLEKTALYREIWGTVLGRAYLSSLLTPEERASRKAALENAHMKESPSPRPGQTSSTPRTAGPVYSGKPPHRGVTHTEEIEEDVVSYVDFDLDEDGKIIGTSTGTGRGEEP